MAKIACAPASCMAFKNSRTMTQLGFGLFALFGRYMCICDVDNDDDYDAAAKTKTTLSIVAGARRVCC